MIEAVSHCSGAATPQYPLYSGSRTGCWSYPQSSHSRTDCSRVSFLSVSEHCQLRSDGPRMLLGPAVGELLNNFAVTIGWMVNSLPPVILRASQSDGLAEATSVNVSWRVHIATLCGRTDCRVLSQSRRLPTETSQSGGLLEVISGLKVVRTIGATCHSARRASPVTVRWQPSNTPSAQCAEGQWASLSLTANVRSLSVSCTCPFEAF